MSVQTRRDHELGRFFTAHSDRVRRAVTRHTHGVCDATIEDACQTAWTKLVRRDDITLDERGLSWLITVAIHEARALAQRERAETPMGAFGPTTSDDELPEPAAHGCGVLEQVAGHLELGERREDLRQLKPQERRALYLKGMGYSYAEIMHLSRGVDVNVAVRVGADVDDMSPTDVIVGFVPWDGVAAARCALALCLDSAARLRAFLCSSSLPLIVLSGRPVSMGGDACIGRFERRRGLIVGGGTARWVIASSPVSCEGGPRVRRPRRDQGWP
jgi:hypothetical protein